jgi:type VI protein secretion system component VasK
LMYAGIFGLIAGVVPMFLDPSYLLSTLPFAAMFSIYFLVPRLNEKRMISSIFASVLATLIAIVVYYAYLFLVHPGQAGPANMTTAIITALAISVLGSLVFVKTHEWTEKKRRDMDEKQRVKREEEAKIKGKVKKHYKIRSKRKYKPKKK